MHLYLTRLGYEVEAIADGKQAWARYRAHAQAYDVVIADLSMPDIDIEALLPEMPAYNPSVQVLVCSGRPFEVRSLRAGVRQHFDFLQKPFVPKMLADAVAGLLSRRVSVTA
jgi:DNA-binding NtrC family response regulator